MNGRERNFVLSMFALVVYHNQGIWNYWNVFLQTADLCTLPFMQRIQNQVSFIVSNLLCRSLFLPIFSDWLKLISSSDMEDSCDRI